MSARYIVGDVRKALAALPARSIDLVLTSPPFLALRSYLPVSHADKALEVGSEATPGEFIDTLLDVVEACGRVLAPHGSMCFELGDTYSGSGGAGGDYGNQGLREGQPKFLGSNGRRNRPADVAAGLLAPTNRPGPKGRDHIDGWPLDKSLCLIPELFRVALVYGFNPLTGRETPRWRARNVIRWVRPNPPVGALGDKFRPATSEMVVICKDRARYFDLDAVRTSGSPNTHARLAQGVQARATTGKKAENPNNNYGSMPEIETSGAPPLDWWKISTQPYAGSHYATWPEKLCETPIDAMCPVRVCVECGQPSRRIVRVDGYTDHNGVLHPVGEKWSSGVANGGGAHSDKPGSRTTTTGWTDCGHNNWRTGVVLDPFAGSGTTLAVATGHGRDAIGIDLDARNADLALDRVGPLLLTIESGETVKV